MMNFVVLSTLQLLLVTSYVSSSYMNMSWDHLPSGCGASRVHPLLRIIDTDKGEKAELGQFPWVARLGEKVGNGKIHFFCEGSLINSYYVITSIHCFDDIDIVRLGENQASGNACDDTGVCALPPQDIKPKRLIPEEVPYEPFTEYDILLIELETPAHYNEFVQPICLFPEPIPFETIVGKMVIVLGWGKTLPSKGSHLMYVTLPVVDTEECKGWYPVNPKWAFCAGDDERSAGNGVFLGDYGGGAVVSSDIDGVVRFYLMGINSFDVPGFSTLTPFINVTHYLSYILYQIEKS